jgi:magnesium transporter
MRESLRKLDRTDTPLIKENTRLFLSDAIDHADHEIEAIDSLRERIGSLLDTRLSLQNNRMNETMMTLTMVASIFIPLTFIAGVYGMNFRHMPELDYAWAYPAVLMLMGAIAALMLLYFKRKKWF